MLKKTKAMLITNRQKRVRLKENLSCLTYNDIDLQLTATPPSQSPVHHHGKNAGILINCPAINTLIT